MTLAEKMKLLRKQRKITQEQLAAGIGVERSSIGKYETGTQPSTEIISRLADYFNVSVDYLLGRSDSVQKNPPQSDGTFEPELTEKDELDISRRLDAMLSDLDKNDSALMFDGEPLDDESRELLISSLENSIRMAKLINKRKYTPKKYRKGTSNDRDSDTPQG